MFVGTSLGEGWERHVNCTMKVHTRRSGGRDGLAITIGR